MRSLLSIVFIFAFVNTMVAQSFNEFAFNEYKSIEGFSNKRQNSSVLLVESYTTEHAIKLRNTGRVATFIGIAAIVVAGAIELPTLGQTTTTTCNPCTIPQPSSQDQIAGALFVGGLAATTTGIILWTKGSRRMKKSNLSFNWKGKGGVLRYRFSE